MPHFRVDDALHSHPKAQRAGDEALGMWARAGSFCMAYLTDGFVPDWWVKQQPKGAAKARKLVEVGLWHAGAMRDGEKGYQFHEFTGPGRQDSREKIEAEREKWRKKKGGQRAGDSPKDSRRVSSVGSPQVSPGDTPGDSRFPTQPNPEENSGYVSESATEPNASGISATPGADLVRAVIPNTFPDAVRTELRLQANALLKQGQSRADVQAALELWLTKTGVGARLLPSFLADVLKDQAGTIAATNGAPANKLRATADLAQRVRAAEQAGTSPYAAATGTPTVRRELM